MDKIDIKIGLAGVLLAGAFLVFSGYGCGNSNTNQTPTTSTGNMVTISGFAFNPPTLKVKIGDTITWTNQDGTNHTVTGSDFQSNPIGKDQTYTHTFSQAGTFSYHCSIHPSMQGEIIAE